MGEKTCQLSAHLKGTFYTKVKCASFLVLVVLLALIEFALKLFFFPPTSWLVSFLLFCFCPASTPPPFFFPSSTTVHAKPQLLLSLSSQAATPHISTLQDFVYIYIFFFFVTTAIFCVGGA